MHLHQTKLTCPSRKLALSLQIKHFHQAHSHFQAKKILSSVNPLHFPIAFPEVFTGKTKGFKTDEPNVTPDLAPSSVEIDIEQYQDDF